MLRIKLNEDETATLVTQDDTELFMFESVDDAMHAYNHWYNLDGGDTILDIYQQDANSSCCDIA